MSYFFAKIFDFGRCFLETGFYFSVYLDVTAYNANDVDCLLNALGGFDDYILISSSSVYPEYCKQPFTENTPIGENKIWCNYGMGKAEVPSLFAALNAGK